MATFQDACRSALVLEAVENYSVADDLSHQAGNNGAGIARECHVYDDERFWSYILDRGNDAWDCKVELSNCYLSEWVARVPGLYWRPESPGLRRVSGELIEQQSERWVTFQPPGKSQQVLGGIGTLRLPPNASGDRIVTLTTNLNASSGIPAIINGEVWEYLGRLGPIEGRLLTHGVARWRRMDVAWAERFPALRGHPRGYLVFEDVDAINIGKDIGPVRFSPFGVMEYLRNDVLLFDFVYISVDSGNRRWRQETEDFFEQYRSQNGRSGRYVTGADVGRPLWDAEFWSPADLRPHLSLIQRRVRSRLQGTETLESILAALQRCLTGTEDLVRLSDEIQLPAAAWRQDRTLAQQISAFLDCVANREGRIEELLQKVTLAYPELVAARHG